MSWEDQGRQQHGWFGHGTGSGGTGPFSPDALHLAAGGDPRKLLKLQDLIGKLWGGNKSLRPSAPERPPGTAAPGVVVPPIQQVPPEKLRFSQRSAGGPGGRSATQQREHIRQFGNISSPVDVVRTPDGLVSIDNTRLMIAREQGLIGIPARVWEPSDPIPLEYGDRFRGLKNWGEVLADRVGRQRPPLPLSGTNDIPRLQGNSHE